MSSSYHQYYQPHFQNPNPNVTVVTSDPQLTSASAPTVSSNYYPSVDLSTYNYSSSTYPPYSQASDQTPSYSVNPNPTSSQPSNQPSYSFPHLEPSHYPYDQNPTAALINDYPNSNPSFNSLYPYTSASYDNNSFGNNGNLGGYGDQGLYDAGVYKYNGAKSEPYGAKGTRSGSDGGVIFDDYGRPISFPGGKELNRSGSFSKIVKAAPKAEEQHDTKGSVQKYRVKLLSEGLGQIDMDVLCFARLVWMGFVYLIQQLAAH